MTKKRKINITKRKVTLDLHFRGKGRVEKPAHTRFAGGVVAPRIGNHLAFRVDRQAPDEDGILNPVIGEDTVEGSFQFNIWGDRRGFLELGRYLIGIAEIDASRDPDFHEHHEITSSDGRTHLHIIVRKGPRKWWR